MKILMSVDGSDYTKRMLAYLAAHPELLGADPDLTFLTVVAQIPPHAASFLDRSVLDGYYEEQAEQVLKPLRSHALQQRWRATTVHRCGHPAEEIARLAGTGHFDLVVMGSHGHAALGSAILGSVASGVLARCRTPVLLVR